MMTRTRLRRSVSFLIALLAIVSFNQLSAQPKHAQTVTNIVLVHGAWADGSSWSRVIPLLEARHFNVIAVQLPLTSLVDDVATTKRAIARITTEQPGPVLLVGHSYGGVVIGEAGNDPNVVGLVYVAAFAPDLSPCREVPPGRWWLAKRGTALRTPFRLLVPTPSI